MAKKGSILLNLLNLTPQKILGVLSAFEDIDEILVIGDSYRGRFLLPYPKLAQVIINTPLFNKNR